MLFINILYILFISVVYTKEIKYDWVITHERIAPDNFEIQGILINGQFPGPTIYATTGDTIKVTVHNQLTSNFTIHWHGITQKGSVESDGVPFVTQDPIPPNGTYIYQFNVNDQSGTHWYHAHTGMDAEHAYGALIIDDKKEIWDDIIKFNPKYKYDEERLLLLSELWHTPTEELIAGLNSPNFTFSGPSDSILTNGRTYDIWDNNTVSKDAKFNEGYSVIKVKKDKTYRFRLISGNGYTQLTFRIPNHKLTLIEMDGTLIDPIEVDYIETTPGQRYSFLLKADQPIDTYYMYTQTTQRYYLPNNGVALLQYEGANLGDKVKTKKVPEDLPLRDSTSRWIENKLITSKWYKKGLSNHYYPVPKRVNKEFNIIVTYREVDGGVIKWFINDHRTYPRNTTLLNEVKSNVYKPQPGIFDVKKGDDVQMIIQHTEIIASGVRCQDHPWHLHGHSFYVVGHGPGFYNPKVDGPKINHYLDTTDKIPMFRDTYTHFVERTEPSSRMSFMPTTREAFRAMFTPVQTKSQELNNDDLPCGWYAIRFKANNPGSWFMHCHMSPHIIMGKSVIINYPKLK